MQMYQSTNLLQGGHKLDIVTSQPDRYITELAHLISPPVHSTLSKSLSPIKVSFVWYHIIAASYL